MGRPTKKKVQLNTDSFLSIAQEAYNELVEQRSTAIRQINENKKKVEVEDSHDLGTMNKINTDLLKIVDTAISKKLDILKMMSNLIFKGDTGAGPTESANITPEDMAMIESLMGNSKGDDDDDDEYKLKD
jgi:CTP-dependent riboflavin kinase